MKTIEEKAKAYDEALERAKYYYNEGKTLEYADDIASDIFPELRKSNDEKIRKALIDYFDDANKVCENPLQSYGIHTDNVIAWLEKLKVFTEHDEGLYYFANSEFTYVGNPTSDDGLVLEKQAEQKKFIDNLTPQEAMDIAVAKCFDEQKPTDKTEPKFEVGDWIIRSAEGFKHNTYLVTEVKDYYVCEELKGRRVTFTFNDVHKNFKLWNISDAKDGDILVASDDSIFLFAGVYDCACRYYVALTNTNHVKINKEAKGGYWETSRAVYPATKEQRDTLFAKMEKSGYKWDAEKKELKLLITNGGDFESETCEQKSAEWSDVDEYMLNETIQHLEELIRIDKAKHLGCDVQYYQRDIDWLEALRQRHTWKPSEKLIEALEDEVRNNKTVFRKKALNELLEQLKKL